MDVKEAVNQAKRYVAQLFADEQIVNLGLEEVEFDDAGPTWSVTVGFSRPWESETVSPAMRSLSPFGPSSYRRCYKVVRVADDTGHVLSVKNREPVSS